MAGECELKSQVELASSMDHHRYGVGVGVVRVLLPWSFRSAEALLDNKVYGRYGPPWMAGNRGPSARSDPQIFLFTLILL